MEPNDHSECERQVERERQEIGRLRVQVEQLTEANNAAAESILIRGVQMSTGVENQRLQREVTRLENELVRARTELTAARRTRLLGSDMGSLMGADIR